MPVGMFTIALVVVTVLISLAAFNNQRLMDQMILWPQQMREPRQYYRLLSSGFVHADFTHLLFNMFTLYFMGSVVEEWFNYIGLSEWLYVLLYLSGIVVASLPSLFKHKNNPYYRSLGASGGVAAVIFASIYFQPWQKIIILVIPMYSIVFAVLYLVFSYYMGRKGKSNINHDAHFWGAVYGLVFTMIVEPTHGQHFIEMLKQAPF